jgi:hypothetical protein
LNALDNYAAGATLQEAIACEQLESERCVREEQTQIKVARKEYARQRFESPVQEGRRALRKSKLSFDFSRAIALRNEGRTFAEIGRELETANTTIWAAFIRRGLDTRKKPKFDVNRAVALWKEGKTFSEIGSELGVHGASVHIAFKRRGIDTTRPPARNAIQRVGGKTKFDVTRAIALRNAGLSWRKIGQALGTSAPNVWRACKNRGLLTGRV